LTELHDLTLNNVSFTHNSAEAEDSYAPIQIWYSSVWFQGITTFLRNKGETGGAIYAHASQLYIEGTVQFVENEGYDGGAIALYEQSEIILTYSMTTPHIASFTKNHARHYGGAMYISKIQVYFQLRCCYRIDS